ncbi:MAG: DUF502 domain-containing protein, partial [Candidatus Latescibacterota bacterium]
IRMFIFRGLLASIPFALSIFAVHFFYSSIDQRVLDLIDEQVGIRFPGLGILLLLVVLYVLGFITSNVIGKRILGWVEQLTARIPLVKTTYQIGKQVSETFSLPERQVFQKAILVECVKPGIWTVGFVTGKVVDQVNGGEIFLKVYVPTPPNPASGNVLLVREQDTRNPGWTIEEALKMVISAGVIGPKELKR